MARLRSHHLPEVFSMGTSQGDLRNVCERDILRSESAQT
jgi:hypothetical protein